MSSSSSSESDSDDDDDSSDSAHKQKQDSGSAAAKKSQAECVLDSEDESDSESSSKGKKKKKKKKQKAKKKKKDKKEKKKKKKDKKAKKTKKGKSAKEKKDKVTKVTKDKKIGARDSVSNQFGKYGVIKAEDFFNKKPEFLLWAMEVKKTSTDSMGQMQQKDLFKEYIEDYNTATMPSKKYYNLQLWDTQQSFKRQRKKQGEEMTDAQKASLAAFDDESARREEIKHLQAKKQEQMITDEVRRMRGDKTKVDDMRHQERLRTQMEMMGRAGQTDGARKIRDRLDPGRKEEDFSEQ